MHLSPMPPHLQQPVPVRLCTCAMACVTCVPAAEVAACISIVEGDLLQVPLRDATVVYAYLLPQGGLSAILLA